MYQQCALCHTQSLSLINAQHKTCLSCRNKICDKCFDVVSLRCRRCAPTAAPPTNSCCVCGTLNVNTATRCMTCARPVCVNCRRYSVGENFVCNNCPMMSHQRRAAEAVDIIAPSIVAQQARPTNTTLPPQPQPLQQPSFACARCFRAIPDPVSGKFSPNVCEFCHECARIICVSCLPSSLTRGLYLCGACCPRIQHEIILSKAPPPLRQNSSNANMTTPVVATNNSNPTRTPTSVPQPASDPVVLQAARLPAGPASIIVRLSNGTDESVCIDEAELLRQYKLRRGATVQYFHTDGEPSTGTIVGFTRRGVVVTDSSGQQGYSVIDPGFIMSDATTSAVPSTVVPGATATNACTTDANYQNNRWTLKEKIFLACGAQGQVHKCVTTGNEVVVMKEMNFNPRADLAEFHRQLSQAQDLRLLAHPHLIKYLDVLSEVSNDVAKITVVMPFYDEKDLKEFIKNREIIDEQHICSLVLQIAKALSYLHTQKPPLVHRDVKPENILMCAGGDQALLMDLDTCKPVAGGPSMTVGRGTMEYMAPEAVSGTATPKSDVWSLGVCMFVLAALPDFPMLPLNGSEVFLNCSSWSDSELRRALIQAIGRRSRFFSRQFVELVIRMLRRDPSDRPNALEVELSLSEILESLLLHTAQPMDWNTA